MGYIGFRIEKKKYLLGSKPNKVSKAINNKSKKSADSKKNSNGHANIRSQKSHAGHLRVHQYRHQ
jgi:hypothetical protein